MAWRAALGPAQGPARRLLTLTTIAILVLSIFAKEVDLTGKHEAGRCAIRGQCGKQSFFGSELPCPDNGLAKEPDAETRKKLVNICGDAWSEGDVCCESAQVTISFTGLRGLQLTRN